MNPFDKILILSERVRELNRRRKLEQINLNLIPGPETDKFFKEQKKIDRSVTQAIKEFENNQLDLEYLKKLRQRSKTKK